MTPLGRPNGTVAMAMAGVGVVVIEAALGRGSSLYAGKLTAPPIMTTWEISYLMQLKP